MEAYFPPRKVPRAFVLKDNKWTHRRPRALRNEGNRGKLQQWREQEEREKREPIFRKLFPLLFSLSLSTHNSLPHSAKPAKTDLIVAQIGEDFVRLPQSCSRSGIGTILRGFVYVGRQGGKEGKSRIVERKATLSLRRSPLLPSSL